MKQRNAFPQNPPTVGSNEHENAGQDTQPYVGGYQVDEKWSQVSSRWVKKKSVSMYNFALQTHETTTE